MAEPTPDSVRAAIATQSAARGFALSHHGAMAAALPDLAGPYAALYRALTLDQRHLTPFEREAIWLGILTACEEPVGTHHVAAFFATGGTQDQATAIFALAAWAAGSRTYAFLQNNWAEDFPAAPTAYTAKAKTLAAPLDEPTARLVLLAINAATPNPWALAQDLAAAYAAQTPEPKMAEALSLIIWPRGVNRFVAATDAWLALLRSGQVTASPPFQAWADTPGQGAYQPSAYQQGKAR
ncbi:hypothetical protein ACQW02_28110 [Humitalea sp. 24SJ18S-53]|uniref:hypothetical protein n=1 Tax=Humitalea sp. 24SJ18S-53 TaxID=3422307 RepID=UPI003D67769C